MNSDRPRARARKTLLIFSQVFVPDPASVGQHFADVAFEMARRGWRVRVFTANRGYENPAVRYAPYEVIGGVEVRRLPFSSFGKKSILTRVIGTASFMLQCIFIALFLPAVDLLWFSTSPPLIGVAAVMAKIFRGIPIAYWAMDLNPDQLIAMGKLRPRSPVARLLEGVNRMILRRSDLIVALDRFMAGRLCRRGPFEGKMRIIPPWPHETHTEDVPHAANPFRARHGLDGKFVIMYSGNHSPANPLATLLQAAVELKDDPRLRFLFVGGGLGKKEVEACIREHRLENAISLPYQPIEDLRYSLSAADVHVVSLGAEMVGIIHPCKIYGAMAVARPILYLGPPQSHITDLLDRHGFGVAVAHGDVPGMLAAIRRLRDTDPNTLSAMGEQAQRILHASLGQRQLCGQICTELEQLAARHGAASD